MIRHTITLGWWLILLSLILAVCLTVFRFAFPLLGDYRESLELQLSKQLGVPVGIGHLETSWRGPFPQASIQQFSLELSSGSGPRVEVALDDISFELNLWQSILDLSPIFQRVDAKGLQVDLYQKEGRWLPDLTGSSTSEQGANTDALWLLADLLLVQPEFAVRNSRFNFQLENGPARSVILEQLLLENVRQEHQLSGAFTMPTLGEQTHLSFALNTQGDIREFATLNIPFYLKLEQLGTQLFDLYDIPLDISDLSTSAEFWGVVDKLQLTSFAGELDIDRALISLPQSDLQLVDTHTKFQLIPLATGHQIQLSDLTFNDGMGRVDLPALALDLVGRPRDFQVTRVMLQALDIAQITQWLARQPLSEPVPSILNSLKPIGLVERMVIDLSDAEIGPVVTADVADLGVDAWSGVPEVKRASGLLEMTKQSGALHLNSQQLLLAPADVYDQPLVFERAQGVLAWDIDDDSVNLRSDKLDVTFKEIEADGQFAIDMPFDRDRQAMLKLLIGLKNADSKYTTDLVPRSQVGDETYNWIANAIGEGYVSEAGLVIYTPTRSLEDRPSPSVELYIDAQALTFDYQSPWPKMTELSGLFHFRDQAFETSVNSAEILDHRIVSGLAWKPQGEDRLRVEVDLEGELGKIDELFRAPVLNDLVGVGLDDWHLSGAHSSHLGLNLMLDNSADPMVRSLSRVQDGRFASESQNIDIQNIAGEIGFDTRSGLRFDAVKAQFLGAPVSVSAKGEKDKTEILFKGTFDTASVIDWASLPLKGIISGPLNTQGKLTLCHSGGCQSQLQIESNIAEAEVKGPAYLRKSAGQGSRLSLMLGLGAPTQVQLNYADKLKGRLELSEPLRGNLRLGAGNASLPAESGLFINGDIPELDLQELYTFIELLSEANDTNQGVELPVRAELGIGRALIGSAFVPELSADFRSLSGTKRLRLNGGAIGEVIWPKAGGNYQASFEAIRLESDQVDRPTQTAKPSFEATDPAILAEIPSIDIKLGDLSWNGTHYGSWKGEVRPRADGVVVQYLEGKMPGIEFEGTADWNLGQFETSKIVLNYTGTDLGQTLTSLGETRIIETDSLQGTLGLIWGGPPWSYATERLDGYFSFTTGKGRLIEAGSGSGILRLFGILNLNSLGRRLTLDFSDLFEKGIVFDRLLGEYVIQQGIVNSGKPLLMEGPSATLTAAGNINLMDKTLDQKVQVTLPLVSNTPLAAVLLGAPQVAGALFLIDKLIGDKLNKVTAISYSMKGPWAEPDLQIDSKAQN